MIWSERRHRIGGNEILIQRADVLVVLAFAVLSSLGTANEDPKRDVVVVELFVGVALPYFSGFLPE